LDAVTIFWFRRDLRLEDNTGLHHALQTGYPILSLFIFDTDILNKLADETDARVNFIYQTLQELNGDLQKIGSGMVIRLGKPAAVFSELLQEYQVQAVFTNRDYEPYAKIRDQEITALLKNKNIAFRDFKDHVVFERKEVVSGSGEVYKVFTLYKNKWLSLLEKNPIVSFPISLQENKFYLFKPNFPDLAAIGFKPSVIPVRVKAYPRQIIENYHTHRDYPARNGTSRLGIHLRFGTISIRQAVAQAQKWNATWLSELIWRDFYTMILDNFPHVAGDAFKLQYNTIPWRKDEKEFRLWCTGQTGYPIVDAGMRELNVTGFMHNRVRMIVASFLTKHLLIDWRWGEAYFADKLLDFEMASNNGGWQWAAGTGTDAQPYFRIFNPYSQAAKFDKAQEYINKWVPEVNTSHYPVPLIDHKFARERALKTYKAALSGS